MSPAIRSATIALAWTCVALALTTLGLLADVLAVRIAAILFALVGVVLAATAVAGSRAAQQQRVELRPEDVGRCGHVVPLLGGVTSTAVCALPHGHPGWHRSATGTEWTQTRGPL